MDHNTASHPMLQTSSTLSDVALGATGVVGAVSIVYSQRLQSEDLAHIKREMKRFLNVPKEIQALVLTADAIITDIHTKITYNQPITEGLRQRVTKYIEEKKKWSHNAQGRDICK